MYYQNKNSYETLGFVNFPLFSKKNHFMKGVYEESVYAQADDGKPKKTNLELIFEVRLEVPLDKLIF